MKNPNKRFISRLLTMALAVVLCFGMAIPAFAAGEITGTETKPAQAAITKTFKMPEGTTTPGVTFGFAFAKKALNENIGTDDLTKMPAIANHTIDFNSGNNPAPVNGIKAITKEVTISLTGVTFPYAGAYTYTLTEQQTLAAGSIVAGKETVVYSKAEYEITFYVSEKANGSGLYISAIGTKIIKNDDGSAGSEAKVDPTPGENGELGAGGLLFTNSYSKTTGGTDPSVEANQVLAISNAVAGDFADTGKYFDYQVTVNKPVIAGAANTYKAYVLDAGGNVIDPTAKNVPAGATIQTDAAGKKYIEFTAGAAQTVYLKHGEKLVFTDVPVGATYVTEGKGVADYKLSAKLTVNGVEITPILEAADYAENLSTGNRLIGETHPNKAAFTNTHKTIPVTGLIINNLPFIMILLIAAGAFVTFIVVKSRKRRNYVASH